MAMLQYLSCVMSQHLSCVSEIERDIFLGLGASVLCLLSFILVLITFTNDRAGKMTIFLALGTVMPIAFVLWLRFVTFENFALPADAFQSNFVIDLGMAACIARGRTPVCLRALWLLSSNVLVYLAAVVQGFLWWADSLFIMSIFAVGRGLPSSSPSQSCFRFPGLVVHL